MSGSAAVMESLSNSPLLNKLVTALCDAFRCFERSLLGAERGLQVDLQLSMSGSDDVV